MKRIFIYEEACIGCHLCEVYCQLKHSQSKDLIKAFKREFPRPLARLQVEEKIPFSFAVPCHHCDEPACVYACLTGALQKDPDSGVVIVNTDRCIGCWTCILACPFGVMKQDLYHGKSVKCDLCLDETVPACVTNCPNEALVYVEEEDDARRVKAKGPKR
jgi:carbon-monoxide dehydrogenase iron sulfur subunit